MTHEGHSIVKYACGHVQSQCRCACADKHVVTLSYRCFDCSKRASDDNFTPTLVTGV